MNKFIKPVFIASAALFVQTVDAQIQDGYYRLCNVGETKYMQLGGTHQLAPELALEQAVASPGSVFRIETGTKQGKEENENSLTNGFKLLRMRSQGIDMAGIFNTIIDEFFSGVALDKLNSDDYNWEYDDENGDHHVVKIGQEVKERIIDRLDLNLYAQPTADGKWQIVATVPSFDGVADMVKEYPDVFTEGNMQKLNDKIKDYKFITNDEMNATLEALAPGQAEKMTYIFTRPTLIWRYMEEMILAAMRSKNLQDSEMYGILNTYRNYFEPKVTYYLVKGEVAIHERTETIDGETITTAELNYKPGDNIGFVSAADLEKASVGLVGKGYDKWTIQAINTEENYLGVTCLTDPDVKDANGNWYCTACMDFAYELTEGMAAMYVSAIEGNQVAYTMIPSGKVPAQTPVILRCQGSDAASNKILPILEDVEPITDNLLTSCPSAFYEAAKRGFSRLLPEDCALIGELSPYGFLGFEPTSEEDKADVEAGRYYVLDVYDGKVGFVRFNGTKLSGNRAWLKLDEPLGDTSKGLGLGLGDDSAATGIEHSILNIDHSSQADGQDPSMFNGQSSMFNGQWSMFNGQSSMTFDLQGRQVNANPAPGIYLVNGRKVVVK